MARGEFALIDAFRERLPGAGARIEVGSGDDAAIIRSGGDRLVTSIDTTIDGVHARLDLGDPTDAARAFGWRALTTALSDLAACGATAGEALVALTAPRTTSDGTLLALVDGLAEAAKTYGAVIIGGDVTAGSAVALTVTVNGWLGADDRPLLRTAARPGDLLGLTGPIGGAGAGLRLQLGDVDPGLLDPQVAAALIAAHLRPVPQLSAGSALRAAGARAAIDLSDGLLADADHVAQASGVIIELDPGAIELCAGVADVARALGHEPLSFAATAGEDFQLLVSVPADRHAAAEAAGITQWIGGVRRPGPGEQPHVAGIALADDGAPGHDHRG